MNTESKPSLQPADTSFLTPAVYEKIDVEKALKLRLAGLTYEEIGNQFGVCKQAVFQRLARFSRLLEDPAVIRGYRANKAELLESVEATLLASLVDPDKLAKANLNNVAYSLSQVNQALRLERNESTQNIGMLTRVIVGSDSDLFTTGSGKTKKKESENASARND